MHVHVIRFYAVTALNETKITQNERTERHLQKLFYLLLCWNGAFLFKSNGRKMQALVIDLTGRGHSGR